MTVAPVSRAVAFAELATSVRHALAANAYLTHEVPGSSVVDVIVPIYNAADDLLACLLAVASKTHHPFRLILINDGSTDSGVSGLLAAIGGAADRLVVIDRPDNRGFVSTVNQGFSLSTSNDVVILNSDTIVSSRWLDKLVAASHRRPNVATVTPLTNNGTLCSVPLPFAENRIPDGYDVDTFDAMVEAASERSFPEAPTGVGFCMLITRAALNAAGDFDAATFGRGYGEENDFCRRVMQMGFVNLIADDTFVYHKGRASFGDGAAALLHGNHGRLRALHPSYDEEVAAYRRNHPLRRFHARLRHRLAISRAGGASREFRVLHVLHRGGGTERHARDLASMMDPRASHHVLTSDGQKLTVDTYHCGMPLDSAQYPLPAPLGNASLSDAGYRIALSTVCWTLDIDLIHVHHLMHNTLDIRDVSAERGIPYVMTLHDYYVVCPSYTLLDPNGHPCLDCRAGVIGSSAAMCLPRLGQPASYLAEHQRDMHAFLQGADGLFAPSESAKQIIAHRYPDLGARITVLEHGQARDPSPASSRDSGPPASRRAGLNVAVIGHLDRHKGLEVFEGILQRRIRADITFHFYGTAGHAGLTRETGSRRAPGGATLICHGAYEAAEIVQRLKADQIDVGLQLAIWPETFSYTLSEFAAAGVPVISGSLGAQGERVSRYHLGWLVPDAPEPEVVLSLLEHLALHPREVQEAMIAMRGEEAVRPLEAMWTDYLEVYRGLVRPRKAASVPPQATSHQQAYIMHLARELAEAASIAAERERELSWFRERMQSPRHRLAETAANAVQKVPLLWPAIAAATEFFLRRQKRRREG